MTLEEKKALDKYILASDKRVEKWSEVDQKAFLKAMDNFPQRRVRSVEERMTRRDINTEERIAALIEERDTTGSPAVACEINAEIRRLTAENAQRQEREQMSEPHLIECCGLRPYITRQVVADQDDWYYYCHCSKCGLIVGDMGWKLNAIASWNDHQELRGRREAWVGATAKQDAENARLTAEIERLREALEAPEADLHTLQPAIIEVCETGPGRIVARHCIEQGRRAIEARAETEQLRKELENANSIIAGALKEGVKDFPKSDLPLGTCDICGSIPCTEDCTSGTGG